MAGAGAGPGKLTVRPFFANGHGEQCIVPGSKKGMVKSARVAFELPEGVHVVTVQEAGKSALVMSADAIRATFARGFNAEKMVLRPSFPKEGNEDAWCSSEFMKFKHEIAMAYRVVEAIKTAEPTREHLELYNFTRDETFVGGKDALPKLLSYDQLLGKLRADPRKYKDTNILRRLCDLYDERIHIRHPGDTVANNRFTPISYILDPDTNMFTDMDGACGLVAYDTFGALDSSTKAALVKRYTLDELNETHDILPNLYLGSIFPTHDEIVSYLNADSTAEAVETIGNEIEDTYMGKVLVVLNREEELKKPLSELIDLIVEKYAPSNDNPVVLYYPLCRVFDVEPTTKAGKKAFEKKVQEAKVESQAMEEGFSGGRRRRRTYRKKKLRNQTRKRRQ